MWCWVPTPHGAQEHQPGSGAHPLALQMPTACRWSPAGTYPLLLSFLGVCDTVQATSQLLQADCKKGETTGACALFALKHPRKNPGKETKHQRTNPYC